MLKKTRLLFTGGFKSNSSSKKRIKKKQQELAAQLKLNRAFQEEVFKRRNERLNLT